MKKYIYIGCGLLLMTFNVASLEVITGHVKVLEPTYMPNSISFSGSSPLT